MDEDNEEFNRAIMESFNQFAAKNRLLLNIQVQNAREIRKDTITGIISTMDAIVEGDIAVLGDDIIQLTLSSENPDVDLSLAGHAVEEFLAPVEKPAAQQLQRNDSVPREHIATIDVSPLREQIEAFGTDIIESLLHR